MRLNLEVMVPRMSRFVPIIRYRVVPTGSTITVQRKKGSRAVTETPTKNPPDVALFATWVASDGRTIVMRLHGIVAEVVETAAASRRSVVLVAIPTGLDEDGGAVATVALVSGDRVPVSATPLQLAHAMTAVTKAQRRRDQRPVRNVPPTARRQIQHQIQQ